MTLTIPPIIVVLAFPAMFALIIGAVLTIIDRISPSARSGHDSVWKRLGSP